MTYFILAFSITIYILAVIFVLKALRELDVILSILEDIKKTDEALSEQKVLDSFEGIKYNNN